RVGSGAGRTATDKPTEIVADGLVVTDPDVSEEEATTLWDQLAKSEADVSFFFMADPTPTIHALSRRARPKLFDWSKLRDQLRAGTVPFEPQKIGGFLFEIGFETEPLLRFRRSPFSYFLLSGLGSFVNRDTPDPVYALFCSPVLESPEQLPLQLGK